MQQKDADEWKHKEDDGKATQLEDIPSDIYFCSISHMTHSLYNSTDNYDSTHPNLEHDSHSTHMLSVILYPHLSYSSHDESHHTSFFSYVPALSFEFVIFPSWLHFTLTNAVFHPYSCCTSRLTSLMTHIAHNDAIT